MLDIDEVRACYFTAHDVVDSFIENQLYTSSRTPLEHLTHFNFEIFCEKKYDIEFCAYNFKELGKHIGGNLQIHDDIVLIIYDSNNNKARQNFTKLHEIYHYIGHYLAGIKGQSFGQSMNNNSLSYDDLILEQEANFGASFMQINDMGLLRCIRNNKSFNDICNEFSMSYSALHNRIMSFLIFEKNLSQQQAYSITNKYRYANKLSELKKVL